MSDYSYLCLCIYLIIYAMKGKPIELLYEEIRSRHAITTEAGYRFVNQDIGLIYSAAHYKDQLPVRTGQPYRLREYRIARILRGSLVYVINLSEYEVRGGDLLICLPGDIIELRNLSPDCDFQMIAPSEKLMPLLPMTRELELTQGVCIRPTEELWQHIGRHYELLWQSLTAMPYCRDTVRHLLSALLFTLKSLYRSQQDTDTSHAGHQDALFHRFLTLVGRHARRERTVGFYASHLYLSPNYLSTLVREASGQTVMEWINRAVTLEAKVLLKQSDLLAYQIADELNFPTPTAFAKFFRRMTGMTPTEYREKT